MATPSGMNRSSAKRPQVNPTMPGRIQLLCLPAIACLIHVSIIRSRVTRFNPGMHSLPPACSVLFHLLLEAPIQGEPRQSKMFSGTTVLTLTAIWGE